LQPSGEVNAYRRDLLAALDLADEQPPPRLLHTTLFRFRGSPRNPGRLLKFLADETIEIPLTAADAVISHEMVYPHLKFQILLRWPIDSLDEHDLRRELRPPNDHPSPVR
jgi:hypothetical protein